MILKIGDDIMSITLHNNQLVKIRMNCSDKLQSAIVRGNPEDNNQYIETLSHIPFQIKTHNSMLYSIYEVIVEWYFSVLFFNN